MPLPVAVELTWVELPIAGLRIHILSKRASARRRISTPSQSLGSKLDLFTCDGGFSISLHRNDAADRMSSRCSGFAGDARDVVDALCRRPP